nr:hypothetical protein [uncultured Campylobacter sp.]
MKSPAAEAAICAAKFKGKISIFADKLMRFASKDKILKFHRAKPGRKRRGILKL